MQQSSSQAFFPILVLYPTELQYSSHFIVSSFITDREETFLHSLHKAKQQLNFNSEF